MFRCPNANTLAAKCRKNQQQQQKEKKYENVVGCNKKTIQTLPMSNKTLFTASIHFILTHLFTIVN